MTYKIKHKLFKMESVVNTIFPWCDLLLKIREPQLMLGRRPRPSFPPEYFMNQERPMVHCQANALH